MNVAMLPSSKLEPRHLRLQAMVYVRQSTQRQLLENQESTRRQYQLAERARHMGWAAPQVQVVDDDLGMSGASSHQRTGFQRLVAAIGLGEVGIVLVTEVSRLSRRNSDWHRVIELCAVFRTLIADEDGIYDPQDPNDRLLLGVKGTLFAAELHILRARMRGNLLNKARRGELALRLPVGYRRLGDGTVVLDPEEQVRQTITRIFERFTNDDCAPSTFVMCMWDTYGLTAGVTRPLAKPGTKWFFINVWPETWPLRAGRKAARQAYSG